MLDYTDLNHKEWRTWLKEQGEKEFHAQQILDWIFKKGVLSWHQMSDLSKELREKLAAHIRFPVLEKVRVTESNDLETFKFLWRLRDGHFIESVLICSDKRRTVCVSSQVGCPARCAFCASGQQGFIRNLRPSEIVEQVLQINQWLAPKSEKVSHIVYMGMGEPLKNYESVVKSIDILSHPDFLNISQRRITVSTVGIVEGIRRLAQEGVKVNLVLSLHAPNQHIRKKIIPYARKYPLEEILAAMDEYFQKTKRDVTYEYTLLAGINDHPDHALELAHLLKGKQCTVNLIPYNPVPGIKLKRPDKKTIKEFRSVLYGSHIVNTCRYTKGDDIAAACGQLALQEKESSSRLPIFNSTLNA
jgi:23S rRNA (adenine2503-C2)-methyltransferase